MCLLWNSITQLLNWLILHLVVGTIDSDLVRSNFYTRHLCVETCCVCLYIRLVRRNLALDKADCHRILSYLHVIERRLGGDIIWVCDDALFICSDIVCVRIYALRVGVDARHVCVNAFCVWADAWRICFNVSHVPQYAQHISINH